MWVVKGCGQHNSCRRKDIECYIGCHGDSGKCLWSQQLAEANSESSLEDESEPDECYFVHYVQYVESALVSMKLYQINCTIANLLIIARKYLRVVLVTHRVTSIEHYGNRRKQNQLH